MDLANEVVARLSEIEDVELGATLGSLGLVGEPETRSGALAVTVGFLDGPPGVREDFASRVDEAVAGLGKVSVRLEALDPEGQARVKQALMTPLMSEAATSRTPVFSLPGSRTRVIGISSGKGGVGKSSVTANVAAELARRGSRVGLLDADVYGFSIPRILGVSRPPRVLDNLIVPPMAHGVRVVSLGFFVEEDTPVIWRGPMLHKTIEQFLVDVFWGELDYLLIDMPPGTGDVTLSLQQYLPKSEIYVVTTPQPSASRVAQRSALAARKLNLPVRGVIENMSDFVTEDGKRYPIFGSGGGQEVASGLRVPLLAQIPLTMALREGGDSGVPVVAGQPDDPAAQALSGLVDRLGDLGPTRRYRSDLRIKAN